MTVWTYLSDKSSSSSDDISITSSTREFFFPLAIPSGLGSSESGVGVRGLLVKPEFLLVS